jgi:hypothetical protein
MAKGYKILSTSKAVREEIVRLMVPGERRVVISAFVGNHAGAYLPHPKGVEIICWPKAGGTNPWELNRLTKQGAIVRFVDSLHMKVYWASNRGAIFTSANLSTNALGSGGLKEAGVLLDHNALDIDGLIASLNPRDFNDHEMQKLYKASRTTPIASPVRRKAPNYLEWYKSATREQWKLGWWDEEVDGSSMAAIDLVKSQYGKATHCDDIYCEKTHYQEHDCALTFRLDENGASQIEWLHVDHIVKVARNDKRHYDADNPFQAIQVHPDKTYQPPPFSITPSFRTAFRNACKNYGIDKIRDRRSMNPPNKLLNMIAANMKE